MVHILIDLELLRVIDRHLNTETAEFIIHLDAVGLHLELDPPALWTLTALGDCFSQKLWVKSTSEEGKDICTSEAMECVPNQGWIDILQSLTALEHDIGCVLALVYTPMVSGMQDAFDSIKIRVHFMREQVDLSAQGFGIEAVCKRLGPGNVANLKKGVVVHPEGDAVLLKFMLHHLAAIDIDLDHGIR